MHLITVRRKPGQFWPRALPILGRYVTRTMPWATLTGGCLAGTAYLAALAYVVDSSHSPLTQTALRFSFLPAIAALAFVPRAPFRPLTQATPVPAWLTPAGQVLLAIPVLALTCWAQLRLINHTIPAGDASQLHPIYPLLAQLTGWCAITVATAACCDRSRYADLGGAVAAPVSLAAIALTSYLPALGRFLIAPPATPHTMTTAWYIVTAAALALTCGAMSDRWHRYTRLLYWPRHAGHAPKG
jgi:hypothetical protein